MESMTHKEEIVTVPTHQDILSCCEEMHERHISNVFIKYRAIRFEFMNKRGMRNRLLRTFLLKLMILVPLVLDNMVRSAAVNNNRISLSDAVKASNMFVCKKPQSRAYNLKDLMQNVHQNSGESTIQPVYIIVKRCDGHSGCCTNPDMSCLPVKSAIYYEEIEIEIWSFETSNRRQWISVEQHGQCSCKITRIMDRYQLEHQQPNITLISN
ncbi:hypothetical protein WN51_09541 [Melipona quadrifasciata]|uniref:Platelet-derived growth factor (PDGF) family profile domain-containing protein n=2 Tax=Melipona TaxID=28651 RepID=A0A0N0U6P7_9HYME|nr:hypothetical protein WN51_09541 [Melipona quadrifasciata]